MFFQRMLPLLGLCQAINITVSQEGDLISLVVTPKANANSPAALHILQVLRGTAQELDEALPEFLASVTLGTKSIQDQLAENEASMQAEKKRLQANSKSKSQSSVASKSDDDEDDDEDDKDTKSGAESGTSTTSGQVNATAATSKSPASETIPHDLFGGED